MKPTSPTAGGGSPANATACQKGIDLIDSLLNPKNPNSRVPSVLTPEESKGLYEIRQLLLSADIANNVIPSDLTNNIGSDDDVGQYLAQEFGGIRRSANFKRTAKTVLNGLKFLNSTKMAMSSQREQTLKGQSLYLPPEWSNMKPSKKSYVYELLSYDKLSKWDFDALGLSVACGDAPLLFIGWAILGAPHAQKAMAASLGLGEPKVEMNTDLYEFVEQFRMKPETLCNFLRVVEGDYSKDNPYHNNIHAADVLQTLFSLLRMGGDKYLNAPLETFSIICAAACHDMGHPGRNNSYQVNAKSDLAIIYNDSSVLESMHAARAYRLIMAAPTDMNLNILAGLQQSQQEAFRAIFCKAILTTDMSHHFSMLAGLRSKIASHGLEDPRKFCQVVDGRNISSVLLFILHAADISNPAKGAPVFEEWCDRCLDEFFAQGDAEKKLNLPVSPMCDRDLTVKTDSQIGFIKFIVRPCFVLLSDFIPNVAKDILPGLESNLNFWEKQKNKEEDAKKQAQKKEEEEATTQIKKNNGEEAKEPVAEEEESKLNGQKETDGGASSIHSDLAEEENPKLDNHDDSSIDSDLD